MPPPPATAASSAQPNSPATAPNATPTPYCPARGSRASPVLRLQAVTSHSKVAGSTPPGEQRHLRQPVPGRRGHEQRAGTQHHLHKQHAARSTTPTWQASNTSAPDAPLAGALAAGGVKVDKIWLSFMHMGRSPCRTDTLKRHLIIGDLPAPDHPAFPTWGNHPLNALPPMSQNQFDKKSEAWSALFSEPMSELVQRYTASVFF